MMDAAQLAQQVSWLDEQRRRDRLEPDPDEMPEQPARGPSFPISYRRLGRAIARALKEDQHGLAA